MLGTGRWTSRRRAAFVAMAWLTLALSGTVEASLTCPGDCGPLDDNAVGVDDLLALLGQWGMPGECDFDGDGVGTSDLLTLLANWGRCLEA